MAFGRNMGKEIFEAGGSVLADRSGFAAFTAAWLYDRMGEKAAFGAIKGIEVSLTTVAESLGGNYADMVVDGFFDGIGDEISLELKAIKRMDEGARKKHIAKTLKKDGADAHDAHGADAHGHGAKHDAAHGHAPPAGDVIHLFDALAALPERDRAQVQQKAQAQEVIAYLDEAYPDYLDAVIHLQDRPGFTRRFLKRITGMTDDVLIKLAIRELVRSEVTKIQHEEAAKPKPFGVRLRQGIDRLDGGINGLLDELGVPALQAGHAHGLPAQHGPADPYRGAAPHTHVTHNNPTQAGPRLGTDWNMLKNRLRGGSGH